MAKDKDDATTSQDPVGGLAFFTSLVFLCVLATANFRALFQIFSLASLSRIGIFVGCFVVGVVLTKVLFPERLCVFFHELKHSILSNLAGNRAKKMKIEDRSGAFTYEYTRKTAAYNAFIALAPYWFPLFTILALPLALVFWGSSVPLIPLAVAGVVYGSDCALNMRDFSPYQTDITNIRGGYRIGALYIVAMNLTLGTILFAWVASDVAGLRTLFHSLWDLVSGIVRWISHAA